MDLADAEKVQGSLSRLAIFPLPGAVLLPLGTVPLHVFEPRYRKMIRDCIAGQGVLALAHQYPASAQAGEEPPRVHPVVGVGLLEQVEPLPDGRYNLVVRGVLRARIEEELRPGEPYRVVRARVLLEDPQELQRPDVRAAAEALRRIVLSLCSQSPGPGAQRLLQVIAPAKDPSSLVDVVAATLVESPRERQALLEQLSVAARIEKVTAKAASLLARAAPRPADKTQLN